MQIDECGWVGCIDPPTGDGLKSDWDGSTLDFGSNVTYTCAEEDTFFEDDREKTNFTLDCMPQGRWQAILPFPSCVKSKNALTAMEFLSNCF